jgi:hypothetical protein
MQGSLLVDFKAWPYSHRIRHRITADVERVQKASMGARHAQSRESQQGKSVEDIWVWYISHEDIPVEDPLCKIRHEMLRKPAPIHEAPESGTHNRIWLRL